MEGVYQRPGPLQPYTRSKLLRSNAINQTTSSLPYELIQHRGCNTGISAKVHNVINGAWMFLTKLLHWQGLLLQEQDQTQGRMPCSRRSHKYF